MPNPNNTPTCAPASRCHRWQSCATCAAIDQARYASRTEHHLHGIAPLALYVLRPTLQHPEAIRKAKQQMLQALAPWPSAWTYETNHDTGAYHINVISRHIQLSAPFDGAYHVERLHAPLRAVAAYIRKQSQRPQPAAGLHKTAGWSTHILDHALRDPGAPPLLQGAILQHRIAPDYEPEPEPNDESDSQRSKRWLAVLYARYPSLKRQQAKPLPAGAGEALKINDQ